MSGVTANETLCKQPSERRLFSMEFANLLSVGETLSNPVVTHAKSNGDTSDLDMDDSPTVSGSQVQFWIAGGTDGVRYRIEVKVDTNIGQILESDGILVVRDK